MTETQQPVHPQIWTIGHGASDFDTLVASLAKHHIQTIVDVRSAPYSKHAPDFTREALQQAAATAGLGYRWMGRKLGGKPPASEADLVSGVEELIGLSATSRVVLLCAEADPAHCHRDSTLAPTLAERGYDVIHILDDGDAMPHQDHLAI
ncbi:MAG: DUF488 domain-containing protein [bacterium]|nr:DUF488 domain-containing protein [bacterium]